MLLKLLLRYALGANHSYARLSPMPGTQAYHRTPSVKAKPFGSLLTSRALTPGPRFGGIEAWLHGGAAG
jgi:hypothetical protein